MTESLSKVCALLRRRDQGRLASLLNGASIKFAWADECLDSVQALAIIRAPVDHFDQLRGLPPEEYREILDAVRDVYPPHDINNMDICKVEFLLDTSSLDEELDPRTKLLEQLDSLRDLMISVATGGHRIDEVNLRYRDLYQRIDASLRKLRIKNPNPYTDLWDWYGKWSSGDLPSYQSRREYIRDLFGPLEQRLREGSTEPGALTDTEPTGWPRVDRTLSEIRKQLAEASSEEQFQAVGTLCRETLISLAQTVYDPERHPPADGKTPSETDAKRMLDAYLAVEISGKQNEAARRHAKASLDFANALQHDRTARFRQAALCAEATASVVNVIAILSGRRDPDAGPE